jgi:hypothetical protein
MVAPHGKQASAEYAAAEKRFIDRQEGAFKEGAFKVLCSYTKHTVLIHYYTHTVLMPYAFKAHLVGKNRKGAGENPFKKRGVDAHFKCIECQFCHDGADSVTGHCPRHCLLKLTDYGQKCDETPAFRCGGYY